MGCWLAEINRDWVRVRILGLPLNSWSQKILKLIGDQCGGFMETEQETMLKNHLHWAWIKVRGDGKLVPTEIEVTSVELVYTILVWVETPVTVRAARQEKGDLGQGPMDNTL